MAAAAALAALSAMLAGPTAAAGFPRPHTAYVESSLRRMAVYRGFDRECDILGDAKEVERAVAAFAEGNATKSEGRVYIERIDVVNSKAMSSVLSSCQSVHAKLYWRNPEDYEDGEPSNWLDDEADSLSSDSQRRFDRMESLDAYNNLRASQKRKKEKTNSIWAWNVFNRILIMPGTKWCGQGDIAENYHDLGYHADVDKCCR